MTRFLFAISALSAVLIACPSVEEGGEGGPCFSNGTCNEGLECRSDLCVEASASPESEPSASPDSEPAASPDSEPAASPDSEPAASPDSEPDAEPTCGPNDTHARCENSDDIYVCEEGESGVFSCNTYCVDQLGQAGGGCVEISATDADCECEAPANAHGDLCVADSNACGFPESGLTCVVENQGDTQGVCRRVCSDFSQCLNDEDAMGLFDTDCCDIFNGSRVCANSSTYPDACSN